MILIHDNNAGLHAANLSAVYMLNMFSYRDGVNVRPPWWNALTDTEVSECVHLLLLAINNSRPRFFLKVIVRLTFCFGNSPDHRGVCCPYQRPSCSIWVRHCGSDGCTRLTKYDQAHKRNQSIGSKPHCATKRRPIGYDDVPIQKRLQI